MGICFGLVGRRMAALWYVADSRCSSRGLCARTCPVGTVAVAPGGRPTWKLHCEGCNRCINLCPEKAINTSAARLGLSLGFLAAFTVAVGPLLAAWVGGSGGTWAALALAHPVYAFVIDPPLNLLQRLPGFAPFFEWGFNQRFRRYLAPGFRPSARADSRGR